MGQNDGWGTANDLGLKIKNAIANKGISNSAISKKVGVTHTTLGAWQSGRSFGSIKQMLHTLILLGFDPVEFFDLEHVEELPDAPKK